MIKQYYKWVIWLIVLGYLFLAPADEFKKVPFSIPHIDKMIHLFLFLILGLLSAKLKINKPSKFNKFGTTIISLTYGLLIEYIQTNYTKSRSGDFTDFLADGIGFFIGLYVFAYLPGYVQKWF